MSAMLAAQTHVPDWGTPFDGEPAPATPSAPTVPAVPRTSTPPGTDWPQRLACLLLETIDGSRPSRQLADITTQRARVHLLRIAPLLTTAQRPRVMRVITNHPAPGVAESSVIVSCGQRARALALRFERTPAGRWLCTDVEAG